MKARMLVAVPVAIVASLVFAASASAIGKAAVVTTTSDSNSLAPPNCSLRDAITAVTNNADAGGCVITSPGGDDKVTFDPSLNGQTITLTQGAVVINNPDDLVITGPGMNQLTVSGNDASRVLNVQTPTSITGLSLVHGKAPQSGNAAQGGAIESTATGPFALVLTDVKVANSVATATDDGTAHSVFADGAGIHSSGGVLRLNQSVVTGNQATSTQTGTGADSAEARGGGIFNQDDVLITDSTIGGNNATATTAGTGQAAATAGIRSDSHLEMSGSTISGNVANATGTSGAARARGGLYETFGTASDVEQSTIAANKADATTSGTKLQAGGLDIANDTNILSSTIALNGPDTATNVAGANITVEGGTNQIENTIIADPRGGGQNCAGGTVTSGGFNDDFSPSLAGPSCLTTPLTSDLTSDPLLAGGGLANNGGQTQTIALQPTSPMIDQGSNANLTNASQDQRGASFPRPIDFSGLPNAANGTDIGAFELQQACPEQAVSPTVTCPTPAGGGGSSGTTSPPSTVPGPTGQRAAALKKCKKKRGTKRKKCIKGANKLPV